MYIHKTRTMPPQPASLIPYVLLTFVTHGQGLQFSMDTTPDTVYCARLQCMFDRDITDSEILSIIGQAVYDVTQPNNAIKLASLSVFGPDLCLRESEISEINATGNISLSHTEMTLSLRNQSQCLTGSFLCELEFVNASSQPDVIRRTLCPWGCGNCYSIEKANARLEKQVAELEKEKVKHEKDVGEMTQQIVALKSEVSRLRAIGVCYKGVPHNNSREIFLLWNKVAALCDTETDGGGWIIIQRRTKGDVDFYRTWNDYKNGFGTPGTDFWIGNDVIHNFTSQGQTELRFDVEYQGKQYYIHYSDFTVGNESSNYRVSMGDYDGNVGYDSFRYNNGSDFSTYDRDTKDTCTSLLRGAWWYSDCTNINLNGVWGAHDLTGLYFHPIVYPGSVNVSEMKVRHV